MRLVDEFKTTVNASVSKKIYHRILGRYGKCDRCSMHGGENARRSPRPDRYKNHREE
jgi:hypothetical protein